MLASAASIVLVHNHPSGDPEPSEDDLTITKRLDPREAGMLIPDHDRRRCRSATLDLVDREFKATRPTQLWVADPT